MNHFLLWVGPDPCDAALGRALLRHYKNANAPTFVRGRNWSLSHACQAGGLGSFSGDRACTLGATDARRRLFWFGHAWSKTDGARPPLSIIVPAAERLSPAALAMLARENCDGVYAMLLVDDDRREVVIAADAVGSFHVCYRAYADGVAVSNSSALLAGLNSPDTLDFLGVQELCSNSVANENRTIWQSVSKLRSGQILAIDAGAPRVRLVAHRPLLSVLDGIQGYSTDPVPAAFQALSGPLQSMHQAGAQGADLRELPWAADLTGGNDSRALMAAILANHIPVASTVSGPPTDPDVMIGERLAAILGIPHFTRPEHGPVTVAEFRDALALTDAEFDAVEYAGVATVHRSHIRDNLQCSVNGSYAELGRGHAWRLGLPGMLFPDAMARTLCTREPLTLQHASVARWHQLCSLKLPTELLTDSARQAATDYFPGMFSRLLAYAGHLPRHAQLDLIHVDLRMERWQGRLASSTNQLWPAVSPWSFREPLAHVLSTSPAVRRNGLFTRQFTLAYAPILAREPLYTGNPAMPFSLGQAHRFWPVVPYFSARAREKLLSRFGQRGRGAVPTGEARQPGICADPEIRRWLKEPLLAESGLFHKDALVGLLAPEQPQTARAHQIWCRLLTVEAALRHQAAFQKVPAR